MEDLLVKAVRTLANLDGDRASILNGVGFNKLDTDFGASLAHQADRWSPKQRRAAWKLTRTYKGQLLRLGIDWSAIPEPPFTEGATPKPKGKVWLTNDTIWFEFSYNPQAVSQVKTVPGARWDKELKQWKAPIQNLGLDMADKFADQFGFEKSEGFKNAVTSAKVHTAKNHAGSTAKESGFDVPGLGGTLRPFQRAGTEYACRNRRILFGDEMGLGKTVEALATIHHEGAYPALIVSPASLKNTWRREAEKWLPGKTINVLSGRKPEPLHDPNITIINYDILGAWEEVLSSKAWKSIVLDESHYVKNRSAQRTKFMESLSEGIPIRLLLTGTPIVNSPQELITQLRILGRINEFGGVYGFLQRYCGWSKYTGMGAPSNLEELNEKLRKVCYVRRLKKDVMTELPPIQRSVVEADLSNRTEYDKAEQDLSDWFREKYRTDEKAIGLTLAQYVTYKMNSLTGGAEVLVRMNALRQIAARGKLQFTREWINNFLDSGEKLVVFAHHQAIQKALVEMFPGCAKIMGGENSEGTDKEKARFQNDPATRIIVCSLLAGGLGHTLTAASNVAFIELGWTPKDIDQAEARVHRISQEADSVNAWFLLAPHTIDVDMYNLNSDKRKVVDASTDGRVLERNVSILSDVLTRLLTKKGEGG